MVDYVVLFVVLLVISVGFVYKKYPFLIAVGVLLIAGNIYFQQYAAVIVNGLGIVYVIWLVVRDKRAAHHEEVG